MAVSATDKPYNENQIFKSIFESLYYILVIMITLLSCLARRMFTTLSKMVGFSCAFCVSVAYFPLVPGVIIFVVAFRNHKAIKSCHNL